MFNYLTRSICNSLLVVPTMYDAAFWEFHARDISNDIDLMCLHCAIPILYLASLQFCCHSLYNLNAAMNQISFYISDSRHIGWMQSMKRKTSNYFFVQQVKPGKRKVVQTNNVSTKSPPVMKTSPYFSGSQSAPVKSVPSLKLQRSSLSTSQKRTSVNSASECLLGRCDDVKSTSINRVRPGKDAHVLSSFKLHREVDVQTTQNGKLASCSQVTPDAGKLTAKLDVPGSSPADPVCIGTRFQGDDSAKVSLTARFNAEGSASAETDTDVTFPSASFVAEDDDIEGRVQVLGEPPRNGSRKRQLCKAVDRIFDDSGTGYKPTVGIISASTVMKIKDEHKSEGCLNYKNSGTPSQGLRRALSGNVNSSPLVEKSEDSGKKRTRKTVVRDVKNSTETSGRKGAIHGRDGICKEEVWEEEFAAFATRISTQSSTAAQLNVTAALNALEEVASKGQILHVEKIPARYFRFMFQITYIRLFDAFPVVVTILISEVISDWWHRADLLLTLTRISSLLRSSRRLFREGNTITRIFGMITLLFYFAICFMVKGMYLVGDTNI